MLDATDPLVAASVSIDLPQSREEVEAMPYRDLLRTAEMLGLDIPAALAAPSA